MVGQKAKGCLSRPGDIRHSASQHEQEAKERLPMHPVNVFSYYHPTVPYCHQFLWFYDFKAYSDPPSPPPPPPVNSWYWCFALFRIQVFTVLWSWIRDRITDPELEDHLTTDPTWSILWPKHLNFKFLKIASSKFLKSLLTFLHFVLVRCESAKYVWCGILTCTPDLHSNF